MVRHDQITQNNNFAISLQYLKKDVSDEIGFLLVYKHEGFLKIDTMTLMAIFKHSQSSKNSKFAMTLQYLKKEVSDESDFLHADKHQRFLQVDFNPLGIKVLYKVILPLLMAMVKHSQSTQSNVQYLYNISKKRLGMGFILCMQMNIKTPKLALIFFMEMGRHVQSTQNKSC